MGPECRLEHTEMVVGVTASAGGAREVSSDVDR